MPASLRALRFSSRGSGNVDACFLVNYCVHFLALSRIHVYAVMVMATSISDALDVTGPAP